MKHLFFVAAAVAAGGVWALCGCANTADYTKFITEKRSEIYLYGDDGVELKVYCVSREQPYAADGICGDMCDRVEIFAKFDTAPAEVTISLEGYEGVMNYGAVEANFTAAYTAPPFHADGVDIRLNCDGEIKDCRALNVGGKGVITCEQAVICASQYDAQLFTSLTRGKSFAGEIYVRLLYDDGCYYYVGVCDRDKNITAYLLDGGTGKVITTKKSDN